MCKPFLTNRHLAKQPGALNLLVLRRLQGENCANLGGIIDKKTSDWRLIKTSKIIEDLDQ